MELKDVSAETTYIDNEFQSHLYGIESDAGGAHRHGGGTFQSHLYGIESGQGLQGHAINRVSIAPLWN